MDIQALRGIAVLLVVFYHAELPGLSAGYLGVDLFFVISGFLITGVIKDGLDQATFRFAAFYYRRAKRLLPAAYVVIFVTALTAPFVVTDATADELPAYVLSAVTFTANILLWMQAGYFDGAAETKPLLHFWSLAVEEQYYLVMPVLLSLVPRRAWLSTVLGIFVTSFSLSLYLAADHPDAAFYLLPTRAWELALGSIGALLPVTARGLHLLSVARVAAIPVILIVPFHPTGLPHPGIDAMFVCLATSTILLGHSGNWLESALSTRVLAFVGDVSYSLYLVHWPVLVFVRASYPGEPPAITLWMGVAISLILSVLLYRYVEEPFRRGFFRVSKRVAAGLVASSCVVAITPGAMNAATGQMARDYEPVFYGHVPCGEVGDKSSLSMPRCSFGEAKRGRVLIIGDSHSRHLAYGLSTSTLANEYQFLSIFEGRCLPFPGRTVIRNGAIDEKCTQAQALMRQALVDQRYNLVLVAARWSIQEPLTQQELEWLKSNASAPVIVIGPTPDPRSQRPCGRPKILPASSCELVEVGEEDLRLNERLARIAIDAGVEYADLIELGCRAGMCPFYLGRQAVYADSNHLSMVGSDYYVERMLPLLSHAMQLSNSPLADLPTGSQP